MTATASVAAIFYRCGFQEGWLEVIDQRSFCGTNKGKNFRYLNDEAPTKASLSGVGFILLDYFSLPSFTHALDALVTANLLRPDSYRTCTFTLAGQEVMSDLGIVIRPDQDLSSFPLSELKLLIVCGGLRTPLRADAHLRTLLKKAAENGVALAGLWNGAWFLGQAGLLRAYRCAIHPEHRPALAETAQHSQVTSESFMVDRDRYTAASPRGALHMVLEWIGQSHGAGLVDGISNILEFDASRDRRLNPAQHIKMAAPLREVVKLMETNLEEPLDLEQMAVWVKMSRRQIERLFRAQLGTTPLRYYLELRVTEARRLLQHSRLTVVEVAVACGFVSPSHFSKCYTAYFGHGPSRETRLEF
ncbi:Transcriptional regulator, AraC family [Pseudomonas amygdali pv. photiniae]|uniref:Transcriptional regulator, AraC family n=1 Tax=Pseudomonas amygdali pv. photiniae TaxID=251724 RepID=A0A0N8RXJ4_PSEA0|nr:Transcriptional regulator, AraC family [Pseudomonas amygdali pv. photiniae]RMS40378.1 Transcriptional regulator, AraC family [Pseudomonas amygdali pv. photiniae]